MMTTLIGIEEEEDEEGRVDAEKDEEDEVVDILALIFRIKIMTMPGYCFEPGTFSVLCLKVFKSI